MLYDYVLSLHCIGALGGRGQYLLLFSTACRAGPRPRIQSVLSLNPARKEEGSWDPQLLSCPKTVV